MRKDGTLRFGDFVSAILHLSDAFGMLRMNLLLFFVYFCTCLRINIFIFILGIFENKDPLQNGTIKLSLTEVRDIFCFFKDQLNFRNLNYDILLFICSG